MAEIELAGLSRQGLDRRTPDPPPPRPQRPPRAAGPLSVQALDLPPRAAARRSGRAWGHPSRLPAQALVLDWGPEVDAPRAIQRHPIQHDGDRRAAASTCPGTYRLRKVDGHREGVVLDSTRKDANEWHDSVLGS